MIDDQRTEQGPEKRRQPRTAERAAPERGTERARAAVRADALARERRAWRARVAGVRGPCALTAAALPCRGPRATSRGRFPTPSSARRREGHTRPVSLTSASPRRQRAAPSRAASRTRGRATPARAAPRAAPRASGRGRSGSRHSADAAQTRVRGSRAGRATARRPRSSVCVRRDTGRAAPDDTGSATRGSSRGSSEPSQSMKQTTVRTGCRQARVARRAETAPRLDDDARAERPGHRAGPVARAVVDDKRPKPVRDPRRAQPAAPRPHRGREGSRRPHGTGCPSGITNCERSDYESRNSAADTSSNRDAPDTVAAHARSS